MPKGTAAYLLVQAQNALIEAFGGSLAGGLICGGLMKLPGI